MSNEAIAEGIKITPPAIVSALSIAGMTPEQWVTVLTIVYLIALIVEKAYRAVKLLRDSSNEAGDAE